MAKRASDVMTQTVGDFEDCKKNEAGVPKRPLKLISDEM